MSWLAIVGLIIQFVKYAKEIYDLWQEWKKVPKVNQDVATVDFKETFKCMKDAKDDASREGLLRRLRERLQVHKCEQ